MLRKALTLPLLFISASAFAWPLVEEAVKQFIDFELDGGRLSSDSYQEYEKKYAHVPDTRDEGDWRVLAIDDYPRISLKTYERY